MLQLGEFFFFFSLLSFMTGKKIGSGQARFRFKRFLLIFFVTENLAPSELKKIRNKLRKQRAREDLERKQAQEKHDKREMHNKSRQQVQVLSYLVFGFSRLYFLCFTFFF